MAARARFVPALSLHDALPISSVADRLRRKTPSRLSLSLDEFRVGAHLPNSKSRWSKPATTGSEDHTTELQQLRHVLCHQTLARQGRSSSAPGDFSGHKLDTDSLYTPSCIKWLRGLALYPRSRYTTLFRSRALQTG